MAALDRGEDRQVHACGGTWMVEGKLIAGGQFTEITRPAAGGAGHPRRVRGAS